jgi:hypothetical protein
MMKITIVNTPTEHRITLMGKLIGPWVGELQRVWEESRERLGNRKAVVDLNDVTLIDNSADGLLSAMLKQGAELIGNGMVNPWLIQALKKGKAEISVRAIRCTKSDCTHITDANFEKLTIVAEGMITLVEVRAHLKREPHDLTLPYGELIDARRAVVHLSSAEVQEIVELLRSCPGRYRPGRTAVVVSTDVAYGVMRMLQILVEDACAVQPFRDLATAEEWLRDQPES